MTLGHKIVALALAAAVTATAGCRLGGTQDRHGSFSLNNYVDARDAVDRAIDALGGQSVSEFADFSASYSGHAYARGQSYHPGPPWDTVAIFGVVAYDSSGRTYREEQYINGGGTDRSYRRAFDGDEGWSLWVARDLLFRMGPSDVSFLKGRPSQFPPETLPHDILARARQAGSSLRWLGQSRVGSIRFSWVSFAEGDGRIVSIGIDEVTGLPGRVERLGWDPLEGDVVRAVEFDDYRQVDGLVVPHTVTFTLGDKPLRTWALSDVRVNQGVDDLFRVPRGIDYAEHPAAFAPSPVAPGVFAVRLYSGPNNGYNTAIVVFDEFVVVLEAPLVDAFYYPIKRMADAVAPGKPIRYLVTTHAHSDHIGGVRAFLAAGIDVVTTPEAVGVISRMADVHGSLGPNPLTDSPRRGRLVPVTDSLVISDDTRSLHLLQVGPTPHVAEILLPYLPAEGIVYVADLFAIPENRVFPPPSATFRRFGAIVEDRELNVRTIIPTHGVVGTAADLVEGLRRD